MSAYMRYHMARADAIFAEFGANVNRAYARGTQLRAVVAIAGEVERHANAIDPREVAAVSVLVDLVIDLAGGMRHIANVMIKDDQPAAVGPEWTATLTDAEVVP